MHQSIPFTAFDCVGAVVAPLHALEYLTLREREPFLLKAGRFQHLEKERQTFVYLFREAVQSRASLCLADTARYCRRQKVGSLIELLGGLCRSAARPHLRAG